MKSRGQVVKAMVLIQRPRDGALLVSEEANPEGELFHRPVGGHVEFGEYARDTVRRELREEIGQALTGVRLAGVLENIFQWGRRRSDQVLRAAKTERLSALYVLALCLGFRRGELLGLRWEDIDLATGTLEVVQTLQRVGGVLRFVRPKTDDSARTIPLPPLCIDALR